MKMRRKLKKKKKIKDENEDIKQEINKIREVSQNKEKKRQK